MTDYSDHITCQELVEQVTEYLEGALPVADSELFEQHLNFCEGCQWYLGEMRGTIATSRRVRIEGMPAQTLEHLLSAFRNRRRS